jgi:hypothetical protein
MNIELIKRTRTNEGLISTVVASLQGVTSTEAEYISQYSVFCTEYLERLSLYLKTKDEAYLAFEDKSKFPLIERLLGGNEPTLFGYSKFITLDREFHYETGDWEDFVFNYNHNDDVYVSIYGDEPVPISGFKEAIASYLGSDQPTMRSFRLIGKGIVDERDIDYSLYKFDIEGVFNEVPKSILRWVYDNLPDCRIGKMLEIELVNSLFK